VVYLVVLWYAVKCRFALHYLNMHIHYLHYTGMRSSVAYYAYTLCATLFEDRHKVKRVCFGDCHQSSLTQLGKTFGAAHYCIMPKLLQHFASSSYF
jgi:hypothetical protein